MHTNIDINKLPLKQKLSIEASISILLRQDSSTTQLVCSKTIFYLSTRLMNASNLTSSNNQFCQLDRISSMFIFCELLLLHFTNLDCTRVPLRKVDIANKDLHRSTSSKLHLLCKNEDCPEPTVSIKANSKIVRQPNPFWTKTNALDLTHQNTAKMQWVFIRH